MILGLFVDDDVPASDTRRPSERRQFQYMNTVKDRVTEIDLLRIIAALAVVFFHYTFRGYAGGGMSIMPYPLLAPIAKYGYFGVDLFFMLSGFVILMTASNGSLTKFVASRIARLYPAFWICCTITFIATLAIGGSRYSSSLSQYLINMTMMNGFFDVPSIDGVYWTIFIEIKFYFLVALLLLIRKIDKAQFFIIGWLVVTVLLELHPSYTLQHFLITDYSPYFIAGALFFLVYRHGLSMTRVGALVLAWVVALRHALGEMHNMVESYNTEFDSRIVMCLITLFFVTMLLVAIKRTGFFGKRDWITIGALTYPLYLLHQHIGFMIFNWTYPAVNSHVLLVATVVAMIFLAHKVNKHIEQRFFHSFKITIENYLATGLQRCLVLFSARP